MVMCVKIGNFNKNDNPDRLNKLGTELLARIKIEPDQVRGPIGDEKDDRVGEKTEPAQDQLRTQPNAL